MNGIQWLVNTPKVIPRQGRIIKKLDLKPSKIVSTCTHSKEANAKFYAANRDKILEQRKLYREAKRNFINAKKRERRAQDRAAREHAAVLRDSRGVSRV